MKLYWFLQKEMELKKRWGARLPVFSTIPWVRVDTGNIELSLRQCSAQLSTYPVANRSFGVIASHEDMQGDLSLLFVVILCERGYKIQLGLPNVYRFGKGTSRELRFLLPSS